MAEKDNQGMSPEETENASKLAEGHWTGWNGEMINRLILLATNQNKGLMEIDPDEFLDFLHFFHNRVFVHGYKHGISSVKDAYQVILEER